MITMTLQQINFVSENLASTYGKRTRATNNERFGRLPLECIHLACAGILFLLHRNANNSAIITIKQLILC